MFPWRSDGPFGFAPSRDQRDGAAAAKPVLPLDLQRPRAIPFQSGRKAGAAGCRRTIAGIEFQRPALCANLRTVGQPGRVGYAEPQFRLREQQVAAFDPASIEIGGQRELCRAGQFGSVYDGTIDGIAFDIGCQRRSHALPQGRHEHFPPHHDRTGAALPTGSDGFHGLFIIRNDQHRPGNGLRIAPSRDDRTLRRPRLILPIVYQHIYHRQRDHQRPTDQRGKQQLHTGAAIAHHYSL